MNFTRTIVNAMMTWVNKRFKENTPDWSQNDPNADGYVKNRTHYAYEDEIVLLPAKQVFEDEQDGLGFVTFDGSAFEIKAGQEYKVTFDNVTYSCAGYTDSSAVGCVCLGNFTIIEGVSGSSGHVDTGEPFVFMHMAAYGVAAIYTPTVDEHTIKIAAIGEKVKKIDQKYLPDLPAMDYVSYEEYQDLTEDQMAIARENIGAGTSNFSGDYRDLTHQPTIYQYVVRYDANQSLTDDDKSKARNNIGAVSKDQVLSVTEVQTLTDRQKELARANIGASDFDGSFESLDNLPNLMTLDTAQNVPNRKVLNFGQNQYVDGSGCGLEINSCMWKDTNGEVNCKTILGLSSLKITSTNADGTSKEMYLGPGKVSAGMDTIEFQRNSSVSGQTVRIINLLEPVNYHDAATKGYVDNAIVDLATEEYVSTKIAEAQLAESDVDLSGYYTKTETDTKIEEAVDAIVHPTVDLTPYAKTADVNTALGSYYTKTDIDNKGYAVATDVANTYAAKTQLDVKANKATTLEGYGITDGATKTYVNTELAKKADAGHVHDDRYYTETEINEKISPITSHIDSGDIHVTSDEKAAWNAKIDAENPTGTGSLSLNRLASSTVGNYSVATGYRTTASGTGSHAEGYKTIASEGYSHAEGAETQASGASSHAEGDKTYASGFASHTEGNQARASGRTSHAEGSGTTASGESSHAEGSDTTASGFASHAEGWNTIAAGMYSHAQGKYNIEDTSNTYAHIVGNGTSLNTRSNAHTLDWDGNAWFAGDVYVGGTNQDDAEKLAKISDIANHIPEISWNDLADKPNILDDDTKDFNITDESGNVILKVDIDGLRTTQVIADTVVVGGYDVQSQLDDKIGFSDIVPIANGGTGAEDGATGLANLFAAGATVLSENQYGETLPSDVSEGTVFFKKATGTVADMDTNLVSELMLKAYPVGSIYMSVNSTSPASLFGGTWTQLKDRFLLGAGDSYSNGATGGQSTIALEESDLPSGAMIFDNTAKTTGWSCGAWSNTHGQNADWYAMPKSQTTNQTYTYPTNMPPYLVVYMWKRTA